MHFGDGCVALFVPGLEGEQAELYEMLVSSLSPEQNNVLQEVFATAQQHMVCVHYHTHTLSQCDVFAFIRLLSLAYPYDVQQTMCRNHLLHNNTHESPVVCVSIKQKAKEGEKGKLPSYTN